MEITENPNYYIQERPYKTKFICFDCRKVYKRKVATDFNGTEDEHPASCPECGIQSTWIGPKFRPPKSDDIKSWNSIAVLSRIGLLCFIGFANNQTVIPTSKKALKTLLEQIKRSYELNIKNWSTANYEPGNSDQIRIFTELAERIKQELKKL